jgi:hypothetical protein
MHDCRSGTVDTRPKRNRYIPRNLQRTWYARLFRREVGKSLRKSKEHRCGIRTLVAENLSHTGHVLYRNLTDERRVDPGIVHATSAPRAHL